MTAGNSADAGAFDLFGNPVQPLRDPRGRPSFARNKENQQVVIDLVGQKFTQSEIADYLGCDEKTLRKYFSRELAKGLTLLRGEAALVRARKMRMGNMAATKAILDEAALALPAAKRETTKQPVAPARGKKEQLNDDAKALPAGWGDLLGGKPN